jgi:hypothetical protein
VLRLDFPVRVMFCLSLVLIFTFPFESHYPFLIYVLFEFVLHASVAARLSVSYMLSHLLELFS